MPVRLFIGNLPYTATEVELREHLAAVAQPTHVFLPIDRVTGKPRGFAFVEFPEREQAEEAIRRLHGQPFKGRPLAVSEARARDEAPGPRAPYVPSSSGSFGGPPAPGGAPGAKPQRNFGPPAKPRSARGAKRGGKGENRPKGPIKVLSHGRVYGMDEADVSDEVTDDFDNLAEGVDEPVDGEE
ncbi:MAG: RNA recognition motif domain-containing protein [Bacteroidales bacterium]